MHRWLSASDLRPEVEIKLHELGLRSTKVYGLWGARLLEQNVRSFLQARTKVNKGIIETMGIDTVQEIELDVMILKLPPFAGVTSEFAKSRFDFKKL